jgi:hypothetical protein
MVADAQYDTAQLPNYEQFAAQCKDHIAALANLLTPADKFDVVAMLECELGTKSES